MANKPLLFTIAAVIGIGSVTNYIALETFFPDDPWVKDEPALDEESSLSDASASPLPNEISSPTATAEIIGVTPDPLTSDAVAPIATPTAVTTNTLDFNAIGSYVNQAGYVCEGETWARPTGDSITWRSENGESVDFFYKFDGETLSLTNKINGKQLSLPMRLMSPGKWLVNGKVMDECRG